MTITFLCNVQYATVCNQLLGSNGIVLWFKHFKLKDFIRFTSYFISYPISSQWAWGLVKLVTTEWIQFSGFVSKQELLSCWKRHSFGYKTWAIYKRKQLECHNILHQCYQLLHQIIILIIFLCYFSNSLSSYVLHFFSD